MAGQVFAIIVGIDKYQSGNVWNLNAAVDDACSIERWLIHDLQVPRRNICTLLDSQATKRNIEERFSSHFLSNSAIEPGDAMIFYFAGHGSSIPAPPGWFDRARGEVPVLCTYDYDTKPSKGSTIVGISDRSLHAMFQELAGVKGDNITLILDTCFCLPSINSDDSKERRYTRFTPTRKATSEDLRAGLWRSAVPRTLGHVANRGFTGMTSDSHVVLSACGAGCTATERKDGGNFTRALLSLKDARPLHKLTYADIAAELVSYMGDHQHAASCGANVDRLLFDGVPFSPDDRFVPVSVQDQGLVRIDAGEMQGISVGTEFAIHSHNHRGSLNTQLGTYVATLVFPTWCLARPKSPSRHPLRSGWARVSRRNNSSPFNANVKSPVLSFFRRSRGTSQAPSRAVEVTQKNGVTILHSEDAGGADISVQIRPNEIVVERRDTLTSAPSSRKSRASSSEDSTDLKTVETTARLRLRLHRKKSAQPSPKVHIRSLVVEAKSNQFVRKVQKTLIPPRRSSFTKTPALTFGRSFTRTKTTYPWSTEQIVLPPAPRSVDLVAH